MIKNVYWFFLKNARYSCHILLNPEFPRQILEKY
jgi:hypothetical protein